MENVLEKNNKNNLIFNFWNISLFFIIYSFAGYLLETTFGIFTKGVLESRQSFLFGPFCPIYAFGALFIVFMLSKYKSNPFLIFSFGLIGCSIIEFITSFIMEEIFNSKWYLRSQKYLFLIIYVF
jgi:uncharacterized membrane protein